MNASNDDKRTTKKAAAKRTGGSDDKDTSKRTQARQETGAEPPGQEDEQAAQKRAGASTGQSPESAEGAASPGQGSDEGEAGADKATSATAEGTLPRPGENKPAGDDGDDGGDGGQQSGSGDDDGEQSSSGDGEQQGNEPQNGPPDTTGPGTGTPAPPESTYRMPSTIVTDPEGAPLDPPQDTPTQVDPPQGYNLSSTDHVAAEAGRQTIAGEDHAGLVDSDGNDVSPDDLFEEAPGSLTMVRATKRVYEKFFYGMTTEPSHRLLFAKGMLVPVGQAERIKAALENAPTPAALQRPE